MPNCRIPDKGDRGLHRLQVALSLRCLIPFEDRSKFGAYQLYVAHAQRERLSLVENFALQEERVRELLSHALKTIPFYRERVAPGFDPYTGEIREILTKVPILTRDDLRENLESLWSRAFDRQQLLSAATGGTTDVPVTLFRDAACSLERYALQQRFNAWTGFLPGTKVCYLWGAQSDFPTSMSHLRKLWEKYLIRRIWLPTSLLNEEILSKYASVIDRFRPQTIVAYPSALAIFAEFLLGNRKTFHVPERIICSAEALHPEQRQVIEKAFSCPVYENYGARDFGMIASQCHAGELHLNPAAAYLEFVPVAGSDGLHEILVTDLTNRAMPLIRYQVNDCVTDLRDPTAQCGCGIGYPIIPKISGRSTDNFVLASGAIVPGISLTNRVIKVCPAFKKIQIIQYTPSEFQLNYVIGLDHTDLNLEELTRTLQSFLGNVRLTYNRVEDIPRERSGKTRFCISKVNPTRLGIASS